MDTVWEQLLLVLALILVNAAFAGTEIALISLREGQLSRLAERGAGGRVLATLARDPNQYLATIQIGITLANLLASATAAVTLSEPLVVALGPLGDAARPVAIVLVTLALTFVTLVLGELAPKRIAMQRAEGWALLAARPLAFVSTVSRPAVWLLARATDVVVRLAGVDPHQQRDDVSEQELREMVAAQPELTDEERAIIDGAFELADRTLRQVLVPRTRVLAFAASTAAADAAQRLAATGHSRAPVHGGELDDLLGVVHVRDLFVGSGTVGEHMTPALVLPESVGALDALRTMQAQREQLAVVIDEHGGVAGVVTVEDLVEELVGEIWDETDPDVQAVQRDTDGTLVVVGSYPVHDLVDLGVDAPEGDYTTVAGLILDRVGRIPETGEQVDVGDWRLEVLDATDRAINQVRLSHLTPADDGRSGQ